MISIASLQRILPASVKNALKPYYRAVFPNQLCVLIWITFRCNYRCSYCPIVTQFNYGDVIGKTQERTPQEWIAALARLPRANLYFSGGEPFLYSGFPELLNGLTMHNLLGVVTNATVKPHVYDRIERPLHLNVSFHREFAKDDDFLARLVALRRLGKFHLNVNIVATRENLSVIPKVSDMLSGEDVSLHVDPFIDPQSSFQYTDEERALLERYVAGDRLNTLDRLSFDDYTPKKCSAGRNYINILPDGSVFRCASGFDYVHSPLRRDALATGPEAPYDPSYFRMGNIFDAAFRLDSQDVICHLPCQAACDRDMATIRRV